MSIQIYNFDCTVILCKGTIKLFSFNFSFVLFVDVGVGSNCLLLENCSEYLSTLKYFLRITVTAEDLIP